MSSIKNIIFDFGNVLIDLHYPRSEAAYRELLEVEGPLRTKEVLIDNGILYQYEKGEISEDDFFTAFKVASEKPLVSNDDMRDAWNAILGDVPAERIQMLKSLAGDFNLYMLSNINHSHASFIHQYLEEVHGINEDDWRGHFKKIYYTHEIGHRKPDASVYEYMLRDSGMVAEESIFFDDLKVNTDMAETFGIQTHTHNPKDDILEIVQHKLGITL